MIESTTRLVEYAGTGSLKIFAYTWHIFDDDHLTVTIIDQNGLETVQTKTTHYSVDGVTIATGGNVTFVTAPLATDTVRIESAQPYLQLTDLRNQGAYQPQHVENALDKIVRMIQQLWYGLYVIVITYGHQPPEYTLATRPDVSDAAIGAFWDGRRIRLREPVTPTQIQTCVQNKTDDTYNWQTDLSGNWS